MCATCGCSDHSGARLTDLQTGETIAISAAHESQPMEIHGLGRGHHHHRNGHGHHHHPEGETHFRVEIVSAAFEGKSRIERHRMINALLADELSGRVHALAISARTPGEAG